MPDATAMAGVDMRLEPGAYRELHWHVASEWALVLNGSCRIQVNKFLQTETSVVNILTPLPGG
jgi:oxalate decarboxylase/phosphoglucose isomerase-like protein (cupin superfamily)